MPLVHWARTTESTRANSSLSLCVYLKTTPDELLRVPFYYLPLPLQTKEMAEGAEFIMPLMIGFLVVGLVMALGGPTGKLHNSYKHRCTAVVLQYEHALHDRCKLVRQCAVLLTAT
jgi:glycerol uptake facilitator-like aquaporin